MDYNKIFRESINEIKSKWKLPPKGFLAGGSICNIVWEKVSGNKAVINDIDIYILDSVIDKASSDELRSKQSYQQKDRIIYDDDYKGISCSYDRSL